MIKHDAAKEAARQLEAVGEQTRLMILYKLAQDGPNYVGQLAAALGLEIVNTSHHLGVLRGCRLVLDAKDGRRVVYTLNPDLFTPPADGDADSLGTLALEGCRINLRKSAGATADGPQPVKKPSKKSKKKGK